MANMDELMLAITYGDIVFSETDDSDGQFYNHKHRYHDDLYMVHGKVIDNKTVVWNDQSDPFLYIRFGVVDGEREYEAFALFDDEKLNSQQIFEAGMKGLEKLSKNKKYWVQFNFGRRVYNEELKGYINVIGDKAYHVLDLPWLDPILDPMTVGVWYAHNREVSCI